MAKQGTEKYKQNIVVFTFRASPYTASKERKKGVCPKPRKTFAKPITLEWLRYSREDNIGSRLFLRLEADAENEKNKAKRKARR